MVPAPSFVFADTGWDAGENFAALGPMPAGCVIERVQFLLNVTVVATINVSAVVTGSREASLAAFEAGVPLLRAAQLTTSRVPAIEGVFAVNELHLMELPVGIMVSSGSTWVHFSYESNQPGSSMGVFSVWVVRMLAIAPAVVVSG